MAVWDAEAISKLFLSEAESEDQRVSEMADKARKNKSLQPVFDRHLARYYVYNYLQGRTFLFSRETLLDELRALAKTTFATPREAFDAERFEQFRQQHIVSLINDLGAKQR